MDIEKLKAEFEAKVMAWYASQEGQTDGHEYERSFVEAMREIELSVLKESLGAVPTNRNKKNASDQPGDGSTE